MFVNLRYAFLYIKRFFQRYKVQLGLTFVVIGLIGALIYQIISQRFDNHISQGIVGTYTERDIPPVVTSLLSKPLVRIDEKGNPQPELAESWSVDKDLKVYTFKLRPNLYWTDGTPVRASELAIPISDVQVSTPDDQTLIFTLADTFSPFPSLLTKPVLKKESLIGTGPYIVKKIQKDERSRVFVSRLDLLPQDTSLPMVVIRFYSNEKVAKQAFVSGNVMSVLGINDYYDLINQQPFKLYSKINYHKIVTIFYNTKDPILSDENYRLALSYTAPTIKNEVEAKTSIPPTNWSFNSTVKDYLDNPTAGKTALSKVKNGLDQTMTLTTTGSLQGVGDAVVAEWKKNGINAKLQVESGIPQNFQALLISVNIPTDPDQYSLWHSTQQATNISKISQPRIDKNLEDGRKINDLEQRKTIYADFQKTLLDHSPATFLYFPKNNVIFLKKIETPLMKLLEWQQGYL